MEHQSKRTTLDFPSARLIKLVRSQLTPWLFSRSLCINDRLGIKELKKGQSWVLKAHYDYQKNKGDLNDAGKQEPIMGIAIMYVKVKE